MAVCTRTFHLVCTLVTATCPAYFSTWQISSSRHISFCHLWASHLSSVVFLFHLPSIIHPPQYLLASSSLSRFFLPDLFFSYYFLGDYTGAIFLFFRFIFLFIFSHSVSHSFFPGVNIPFISSCWLLLLLAILFPNMHHFLTQKSFPHSRFLSLPACLSGCLSQSLFLFLPPSISFNIPLYSSATNSGACHSYFPFTWFLWRKFHIHHCLQLHINLHFVSLPSTSLFVFVRLSSPQLPFVTSQAWLLLLLLLRRCTTLSSLLIDLYRYLQWHFSIPFQQHNVPSIASLFPNPFHRPCFSVT